MTIGRIGDDIHDPTMERCQGCCQSQLMCEVCMDHDNGRRCCGICTHHHTPATLATYNALDR